MAPGMGSQARGRPGSRGEEVWVQFEGVVGGPDRDRTDDLFHAMEARSQLRHRPTNFYSGGVRGLESTLEVAEGTFGGLCGV